MGRSQETFSKKEVRSKAEKKRKEKAEKRAAKKDQGKKSGLDNMLAYVDENGQLTSTPPDPKKKKTFKAEDIVIAVPTRTNEAYDPIKKGVVAFFNDSKGYGFIKDSETKESFFVHINNIEDEIKEGNLVSFEIEMGQKGPTAVKVKLSK
jgi:cold shock CspA family protein